MEDMMKLSVDGKRVLTNDEMRIFKNNIIFGYNDDNGIAQIFTNGAGNCIVEDCGMNIVYTDNKEYITK